MIEVINNLDTVYIWVSIALVLVVAEIFVSGAVLIFFALGAMAAAGIALLTDDISIQIGGFGIVSIVSALLLRKIFRSTINAPALSQDGIQLNKPELAYVGQSTVVINAIEGGAGRIKVGDSTWRCTGPDAPENSKVYIADYQNGSFIVELRDGNPPISH